MTCISSMVIFPHHQGAIDMAEDLKKNTQRFELLTTVDCLSANSIGKTSKKAYC
jgi:uncharacterized protein (DUF305 family)